MILIQHQWANTFHDESVSQAGSRMGTDNFRKMLKGVKKLYKIRSDRKVVQKIKFYLFTLFSCSQVPPLTIQQNLPDWGECGKSKGCFLHPLPGNTRCVGDDCQAAVSYRQNGDLFTFEMSAAGQDSYLAIGFSDDELMVGQTTRLWWVVMIFRADNKVIMG